MKWSSPSPRRRSQELAHPDTGGVHAAPSQRTFAVVRLVAIYLLISGAWILLSDLAVAALVDDPRTIHQMQTYKGWFFVAVTGVLLGWLVWGDLKRIEEAGVVVRDSEERLRLALKAANQGMYDLDIPSGAAQVNPEYAWMLGYDPADFAESSGQWLARLHPEDRERAEATFREYVAGKLPEYRLEFRLRTSSGGWKWILSVGQIVEREADGRPRRMLGTHTDINTLKNLESELREANRKLTEALHYNRTILDASPVGLITYQASGEVVSANEAAARLSGGTVEQVKTQNFRELESWRRYGLRTAAETALATQQEQKLETQLTSSFGKRLWLNMRFVPFEHAGRPHLLLVVMDVMAQREAEEAQRRTNETLLAIVNSSPAAIFDIGSDGRVQSWWNPAAEKMFGWKREEAMGRILPILPEHTLAEFASLRQRVASGASLSGIEVRRWRRDATPVDISLATAPLTDVTGRVTGIVAVAIDVTDHKRAEAALRESEAKFRALVEQSLTGVYVIQDSRFVYANPGLSCIFGYSEVELMNLGPQDLVHEADRARVAENLRKRLAGEERTLQYSFRARHKDGRLLEVEVLGSRTEFNGRPAVMGTALDITARREAEEQQRRLTAEKDQLIQRLQLHFNAMPIGCIVTAPDLTILDWNPAAERIFGFAREEMVGQQPYGRIIADSERKFVETFIAELRQGHQTRSLINENRTSQGRRIVCEWHDTPLLNDAGEVVGLLAMVQDVTERIRAEAALRELSARLLTAQDEERRRIARELHDTTAQHLAALALNLAVISKLVVNAPPKAVQILADCRDLVEKAALEVRTTSYLLHPPLLEAAGLTGAVRDYASGFARRSGIKVELELQEDVGRLPAEVELALFRMVQEGLGNIHRHSGSATATIRLAREPDRVSLAIEDTGHGMPAEILSALRSKTGAVGVGVAGMRERLHQLKGRLEIDSGTGGTTVRAILNVKNTESKSQ
ncbi:MAG: PAS domain S-box protein [Verrucomicrobia bacterium]|nr:PAS domain S-box protein [Verrucomicrobiota bacterium]